MSKEARYAIPERVAQRLLTNTNRSGKPYYVVADGCWWGATPTPLIVTWREDGRRVGMAASRAVFIAFGGLISEGYVVDHKCNNGSWGGKLCWNPNHLQAVTNAENSRYRGARDGTQYQLHKIHCPQGHTYDEANTYTYQGRRSCRKCARAATRRWKARKKQANK